ncbi:bactofilin family protein [Bacillus smithii]|uniref:bactofilin family protein n=1 Tax=Bacillus smithii TaxID=1479 RepID=UPI002E1A1806|nr:polymer-forming cytoskeletal protein [Bacillus smithii]MED1457092.1 polymer-forming cytoskeletal protein [Bacillus smithii]
MERQDLVIAGFGNASGGNYNLVKIAGNGELQGDLDCIELYIQGNAKILGNVKSEATYVSGTAKMHGALHSEKIKIQGTASIDGDVECKEVRFNGSGKVKGNVTAEELHIHGGATITGDCSSEVFEANGNFRVGGLLNAGDIQIQLFGHCQAKEIGGENIEVKKQRRIFFKKWFFNAVLNAESIEGDEIYLENTKAKVVRGNRVILGPGCDIEFVEYKNRFQCDKRSKVKTSKKL